LRKRDQFTKNIQPLFRRERLIVFEIRLVGFGKGAKDASHFFHAQSLSLDRSYGQGILSVLQPGLKVSAIGCGAAALLPACLSLVTGVVFSP